MAKKKGLTFFDKILVAFSIFALIFLLTSSFAGSFDPRKYALIAFAGLAYPFVLLLNAILLLWWALKKKWVLSVIILTTIIIGGKTLNSTFKFFGSEGEITKKAGTIRLMTYNVHSFKEFGSGNDANVKRKMLDIIRTQQPDVICFQEFYSRFKGEFDLTDSIKSILNSPYYYFVPASKNEFEAIGMAIFSRYPLENKSNVKFDDVAGNGSIYADLTIEGKQLRIYNVHLKSISFEKQDYTYLDKVTKEINPDKQSSKRIYRMLRDAFKNRARHVEIMKEEISNCKTPYIIAGDFNDTPASYAVNQLLIGMNNAFVSQGKGLGRTYNGKFPNFQIDYIASTKDVEIENYQVTEAKLSDHYPVRADIRLK
ncbi:MAG: endonuclease [Pedobacter sp.]|nr:MAG: endonuclease [Pedobacter sp.]